MLQVDYDLIYVWQALFPPGTKIISIKFFFFFLNVVFCVQLRQQLTSLIRRVKT